MERGKPIEKMFGSGEVKLAKEIGGEGQLPCRTKYTNLNMHWRRGNQYGINVILLQKGMENVLKKKLGKKILL